jgi:tetratricopeptide (TPR) repeat protein
MGWEQMRNFMRTITTIILAVALSCILAAENLEKTQKKELEAQAKALIAEAKNLEKSGQLPEAREKYAESQAMLDSKEATNAIKHIDDEIRKRVKDSLDSSRKLYESRKYKEAASMLDSNMRLGAMQGTLSYDLAISYYKLGERNKAIENLDTAISDTQDPKEKEKLRELLTYFSVGENGVSISANTVGANTKDQVGRINTLIGNVGWETSLEDQNGEEGPEVSFAESGTATPQAPSPVALKTSDARGADVLPAAVRDSSLCTALEDAKTTFASSATVVFDRANCAETNGRPAEAVRLLQKYLEMSPDALDAQTVHARISDLQSLLALSGDNSLEIRRQYAAAYGYLASRRYNRALASFKNASRIAPDFPLTYWKMGLIYEAMADVNAARENFTRYQQLITDQTAKDEANLHLTTLDAKKTKYDEEVDDAEDILSELFNRGMNLTFNMGPNRSAIRAQRARIKKKQDRKKDMYRTGGFAVPYAYAQQQLARAGEHLQVALALFPLGAEANELMGLFFLQANDGHAATKSFDAVASQSLPVSFYAEMRGHKLDHGVKCELTKDRVRFIFLSSYDKKGNPIAPDKNAGDDGLGDITLAPGDERQPFDSLDLGLDEIKKVETNKGVLVLKLAKQEIMLAPIYLPSFTPVEGPPARRFANNYTRLFIRYPGLEDSKLGAEGMTGGEKFVMGYKLATAGANIAMNLNPLGAIQATQSAIGIARTIHQAMASLSVSFASWERSVEDQQELLAGETFKAIPSQPATLEFAQELK